MQVRDLTVANADKRLTIAILDGRNDNIKKKASGLLWKSYVDLLVGHHWRMLP
jgi:hypothetical protein